MYLSKGEREHYLIALAAYENLDMWLKDSKSQLGKEVARNLKTARTYIQKGLRTYAERLDADQYKRIVIDAKSHDIAITPKRTVTNDDESRVKTDDLYDTIDWVLYFKCRECREDAFKRCKLYQAMMDMRIPVAEIDPKGCPYRLEVSE